MKKYQRAIKVEIEVKSLLTKVFYFQ